MKKENRLSGSMVPSMKITPVQAGIERFWNIEIRCNFPEETSVEKKRTLKEEAKKKGCNLRCNHITDREGLMTLIGAIQDDLPHYEFKFIEQVDVTRERTRVPTKIGKRMKREEMQKK